MSATAPTACAKCGSERVWRRNGTRKGKLQIKALCKACHRDGLARQRAKHGGAAKRNKVWENQNREKALAHRKVEHHLKAGNIVRRPCERCGSADSQAHHDDYRVPLEVRWLCAMHHAERHRELEVATRNTSPAPAIAAGVIPLAPAALFDRVAA